MPFLSRHGSPAFGFAMTGMVVTSDISLINGISCLGPVEQLAPIASTPRLSNTIAAVFASVPKSVLPSDSKVMVDKIGRLQHSFIAITAARIS